MRITGDLIDEGKGNKAEGLRILGGFRRCMETDRKGKLKNGFGSDSCDVRIEISCDGSCSTGLP
jgi:hypothetical protein